MATYQHFRLKEHDSTALLKACVKTLNRGGLAILPTETVYGVGTKEGSRRGKRRLHQLKEDRTTPYSRAVCTAEMAVQQWGDAGSLTKRLMTAFWPGPLTIIAPGRDGKTVGLRCPAHPWTRQLIQSLKSPVLLPSANLHGQPAPASIEEISPQVLGAVKIVIDDGPCPSRTPSTVVTVSDISIRLLREGALSIDALRAQARPTLLVVCSGNTCRSPMASALIEASFQTSAIENQLVPPKVISAGIHASAGDPPSQNASRCLKERGIDISHQVSQPLTKELLQTADLTLAMTEEQLHEIRTTHPNASINADLFDPAGTEVQDPFGQDLEGYRRTAEILATLADTRVARSVNPGDFT